MTICLRPSKEKNIAKAAEHFDEAKKYYVQAAGRDPENLDANYSLGTLDHNKAAVRLQALNAMAEDFSKAGMQRVEATKTKIAGYVEQALQHLQKAESIDPNDLNTLLALKEICSRKEDALSAEFKNRIDIVQGGGKNAAPFFRK